ncbi:hypothetical protein QDR37_01870 [Amnibacterium sp. CER49]|uniref:hypothetical protein n=1 Tax=Amnibacterium sp. CER49 TaxID=3039161 RepID=UPI00244C13CC|nr:hypothetical protein [Amnibacterium sp. CER49]MDH2442683.1 hypothetical protein [Amnibacterium sp. CER49]
MDDVVAWLLEGDPAVRGQVLRDLTDATDEQIAAERTRAATEGWGARLLAEQGENGLWDGGVYRPGWVDESRPFFDAWTATHFALSLLRELDPDPASPAVRVALDRVREQVRWDIGDRPYFEGEAEPCVNGAVLVNAMWAGEPGDRVVEALLDRRLRREGWNCFDRDGGGTFSFHSTLAVVEGLLSFERAGGSHPEARPARLAAEELLLERSLLHRLSDGEPADPRFALPAFPAWWYYDVLRALDHFRLARPGGDPRLADAIAVLRRLRRPDGRWRIEQTHMGPTLFELSGEEEGHPSRMVTLRALRVLRWWEALPDQSRRSDQEIRPPSSSSSP